MGRSPGLRIDQHVVYLTERAISTQNGIPFDNTDTIHDLTLFFSIHALPPLPQMFDNKKTLAT